MRGEDGEVAARVVADRGRAQQGPDQSVVESALAHAPPVDEPDGGRPDQQGGAVRWAGDPADARGHHGDGHHTQRASHPGEVVVGPARALLEAQDVRGQAGKHVRLRAKARVGAGVEAAVEHVVGHGTQPDRRNASHMYPSRGLVEQRRQMVMGLLAHVPESVGDRSPAATVTSGGRGAALAPPPGRARSGGRSLINSAGLRRPRRCPW